MVICSRAFVGALSIIRESFFPGLSKGDVSQFAGIL